MKIIELTDTFIVFAGENTPNEYTATFNKEGLFSPIKGEFVAEHNSATFSWREKNLVDTQMFKFVYPEESEF